MKKAIVILLAAALVLALAACGGGSGTPSGGENTTTPPSTPTPSDSTTTPEMTLEQTRGLTLGETVRTDSFEFTLTRVEFAEELTNSSFKAGEGASDKNYLLPTATHKDKNPYVAHEGKILISYSYNLKYFGKEEIDFDVFIIPRLSYGDFVFASRGTSDSISFTGSNCAVSAKVGNWGTESRKLLNPFSDNDFEIRAYVEVPRELVDNTDTPLSMSFELEGNAFTYPVEAERLVFKEAKLAIDRELQGLWVEDGVVEGLTVSYLFADGRVTYTYDYKDDTYDNVKEGSYEIEHTTITLSYDEPTSTKTLDYILMDGKLSLYGYTSSNVKVEFIKQS